MSSLLSLLAALIGAGYLLRRLGLASGSAAKDLTNVIFFVTLPPLVFDSLHRAELSWRLLAPPLIAWGIALVGIALAFWLAKRLGLSRPARGAFVICFAFGNTTFLGYPFTEALLGSTALPPAIFYDLLGASVAANTAGAAVAAHDGERSGSAAGRWRALLGFPPLWAMAAALALHPVEVPAPVSEILTRIGSLTTPLTMLSLGLAVDLKAWREEWRLVCLVTVGRLVVLPALAFAAAMALDLPRPLGDASVLQSAMPTMFYALTLTLAFGLRANLTVNAIMVSTLASFVTLPLWQLLLCRFR